MDWKSRLQKVKNKYLTIYHFFYKKSRDNKMIIDIVHALTTEGVNPVSAIKKIKNIAVISLIFRFETFKVLKQVVSPIIIKPDMRARYS